MLIQYRNLLVDISYFHIRGVGAYMGNDFYGGGGGGDLAPWFTLFCFFVYKYLINE